jgi:hypothetical protein
VPRRGGVSAGRPPIQYGISAICSPGVRPPAQPDSDKHARHRRTDLIVVVARFISDLYREIVASPGTSILATVGVDLT